MKAYEAYKASLTGEKLENFLKMEEMLQAHPTAFNLTTDSEGTPYAILLGDVAEDTVSDVVYTISPVYGQYAFYVLSADGLSCYHDTKTDNPEVLDNKDKIQSGEIKINDATVENMVLNGASGELLPVGKVEIPSDNITSPYFTGERRLKCIRTNLFNLPDKERENFEKKIAKTEAKIKETEQTA